MKNIKRLVVLTIVAMCLFIPSSINAAECNTYTIEGICKMADGCEWNNNKCISVHTDIPNSTCRSIVSDKVCKSTNGCVWNSETSTCSVDSTDLEVKVIHSSNSSSSGNKSPIEFCASTAVIWQIVGWVFLVLKILIPLLLIILGVLDFSKAVMASKDDEIKKAAKSLGMRAISAVIIFFIPTIVSIIMGIIVDFKDSGAKADYEVCKTCILNPSKCDTSKDVGKQ